MFELTSEQRDIKKLLLSDGLSHFYDGICGP